jgi:CHAT domain-containing protein/Tfp pilus assembly protein PilF
MKTPIFFFLLILLLAFTLFAQNTEEQAAREIVGKFCNAIIKKDVNKIREINEGFWGEGSFAYWQNFIERGSFVQYPLKSFKIRQIKIDGEDAVARVFWERLDSKTNQSVEVFQENHWLFFLKKLNSQWKVSNLITAENDLIARILQTNSFEERQRLIKSEPDLNTHRIIFVILFRLQNDGKYEQTEDFYKLAEWYNDEFYKGKDESRFVNTILNVLNSRALTQKSLGNYTEAMRFYLESAKIAEEYQTRSGRVVGGTALTQVNIGRLYFQQGNLEQAENFTLKALKTLEGADRNRQNVLFNSIYNLLGDIYFQRNELQKALEFYVEAKDGEPHGIGAIYLRQNELTEALKIFQNSIDSTDRIIAAKDKVKLPLMIEALTSVSEIYRRQNNLGKSLEAARRGIEFAEQSKNPELIFAAHNNLGKTFLTNGKFDEAESSFHRAIESVEGGRQKIVGGEDAGISYFENRVEPYHQIVKILVEKGDAANALNFSERAKSRVLNDILQGGRVEWQKVLNDEDRKKEVSLRTKLTELNRLQTVLRYQQEVDKERIAQITNEIEQVRLDYDFLQTSAFAKYPELSRSKGISKVIENNEIITLIPSLNTALLEFTVTDDQIYLFVATKEKSEKLNLQVYQLEGTKQDIIRSANDFRQLIIEKNLNYKEHARKLFDTLFKQASQQLKNKDNLVIVPDAELWNIPFAALIEPNNRFLIENRTIGFAQSLTALKELQNIKTINTNLKGGLLAIGNPRLDEKTIALVKSEKRSDLGDLPEAETEVLALRKLYGANSKILIRSEAREYVWKKEAGNYRYLHLATHGFSNSIKPLYSYLFLATETNNLQDDGLLEAWEVMNLRLNADFVVLSACETAQGRANTGEGLIGLSWVFAVANVPHVIASQWKVNSIATSELMIEFHRQIKNSKNNSVAKSLQSAMRNQLTKASFQHPFYWAGFISIGK